MGARVLPARLLSEILGMEDLVTVSPEIASRLTLHLSDPRDEDLGMTFNDRIEPRGQRWPKKPLFLFDPFSPGHLDRPRVKGMKFETEVAVALEDPPWGLVKCAIEMLDAGEGNSFAILSLEPNTFVQALRGLNGFHLEWRITGDSLDDYIHYRAGDPKGSTATAFLNKHDAQNSGQQRDLLSLDQVTGAFRHFFDREGPPQSLIWRELHL